MKTYQCKECGRELLPESTICLNCNEPADLPIPSEMRCECGFLLCKLGVDAIEVKCRRCKRLVYIPIENLDQRFERNKVKMKEAREAFTEKRPRPAGDQRGQYCATCGQYKPNVVYGKCLDCRTESIKVQYKSRHR